MRMQRWLIVEEWVCCRVDHVAGSVDSPGIPAVSRPDVADATLGRSGWPSQLNVVDVNFKQTGEYFTKHLFLTSDHC